MQLDLDNLPTDTALLHRLVRDIVGGLEHRDTEIKRLKSAAQAGYWRGP
jgi:transposase